MTSKIKRKPETKPAVNLCELIEQFSCENSCRDYLEELRWPDGITCPDCESKSISRITTRNQFDCNDCRSRFSVKSGTMLHDSHLPLFKWFLAVYMMCESKKGVSSNQLKRALGVAYKTAWYLTHRIREAMGDVNNQQGKLTGTVEADETFVGGKVRGKGKGYKGNKKAVAVAVQRDGAARLQIIPDRTRKTLHKFLDKHIENSADAIYTDDWKAYDGIEAKKGIEHRTVNHSEDEWVIDGIIHSNTAESVWSLLKRSIIGAYHHISHKHLDAYLDELEWRFSNRHNPYLFRDTLLALLGSENMEYKELIA